MAAVDAYAVLAERHRYGNSLRYRRILEFLMTPQQANIVAELPSPPEDIASKLGLTPKTVKGEIETLFERGVVFPKNFQTRETPRFAREVFQLHDASQSIHGLNIYPDEKKKEMFRLWEDFCEEEWYPDRLKAIDKMEHPPMRVIPAYASVKDLPDVQPYEDMREILKAQEILAVCSCSCRKRRTTLDMPCAHSHDVNCFQFNRGAEYADVRGTGRKLTYDQAMKLVDEIEADGLVHNWRNDRGMATTVMCHCCIDCCMIWHPIDTHQADIGKYWAKSRFQAAVNQQECTGCQTCVERCMFDAIEMVKVPGTKKLKAVVNPDKCFGCGVCVLKCESEALAMKTIRPPESIPEMAMARSH